MTKHIIDGTRASKESGRSGHYVRIASDQHPRPQSKILQKRPLDTDQATRTRRFLEIDRQKTN